MNSGEQQDAANINLEDQLRNMILGNVTIANGENSPSSGPRGTHHPNRRSFPRVGQSRNSQYQQNQIHHQTSTGNSVHETRGGRRGSSQGQWTRQRDVSHGEIPSATGNWGKPQEEQSAANNRNSYQQRPPRYSQSHGHYQYREQGRSYPTNPAAAPEPTQWPHNNGPHQMVQHSPRQRNFQAQSHRLEQTPENAFLQVEFLDGLASQEIPKVEITPAELEEKEVFRKHLEGILKQALAYGYAGDVETISLAGFGSVASGFATSGSDMDLAIVPSWKDSSRPQSFEIDKKLPRLFERAILDSKLGGRLLTRTRVPILKVCQHPTEALYQALLDERNGWDSLPEEQKYPTAQVAEIPPRSLVDTDHEKPLELMQHTVENGKAFESSDDPGVSLDTKALEKLVQPNASSVTLEQSENSTSLKVPESASDTTRERKSRPERPWAREKVLGPLDFPKTGVGIQCDINFSNLLGLHNTQLLRCYSLCDVRVRPMVLFVKAWAKRRKINSSYSGTLSSYGWVLMVLHYLCNIAQPPVLPNLQLSWRPPTDLQGLEQVFRQTEVQGYTVRFWRNEEEIIHAAQSNLLTRNTHTLGALLRGFFQYYAALPTGYIYGPRPPTFSWVTEVLSLRTPGGILSKREKDWTGAKTTMSDGKEVRHRYLFAIEDPFELDHNVARTVTHNGIVAIRDEFRRAWRILSAVGRHQQPEGGLFDEVVEKVPSKTANEDKAEQFEATIEMVPAENRDQQEVKREGIIAPEKKRKESIHTNLMSASKLDDDWPAITKKS